MKYPPFCDIILINFNSLSENEIKSISQWFYDCLEEELNAGEYKIYKPMPSPIDKIKNRIRYRIIVKGDMTIKTNEILNKILKKLYEKNLKTTRITIDVNPNNMV